MDLKNIQVNIQFQKELLNMLDTYDFDDSNTCQITSLPLDENYAVTLECKHRFNYHSLYTEICNQKYKYETYVFSKLDFDTQTNIRNNNADYFIKCPYCRNIQFNILPYYPELGLPLKYGVNTTDKSTINSVLDTLIYTKTIYNTLDNNITYISQSGEIYCIGKCHKIINSFGDLCDCKYVKFIPDTTISYCHRHYKNGFKQYETNLKKNEKILNKQKLLDEKNKLLTNLNAERAKQGLPLLKNLPRKVKETNNPDETKAIKEKVACIQILKSGPKKGSRCTCFATSNSEYCSRHNKNNVA